MDKQSTLVFLPSWPFVDIFWALGIALVHKLHKVAWGGEVGINLLTFLYLFIFKLYCNTNLMTKFKFDVCFYLLKTLKQQHWLYKFTTTHKITPLSTQRKDLTNETKEERAWLVLGWLRNSNFKILQNTKFWRNYFESREISQK